MSQASQAMSALLEHQTILVVDDNESARYATARVLQSAGFRVIEAATGGAALAAAEKGIALLVLDINLPDIDGFEVCRQLRARTETAYLPIVHLSATFTQSMDAKLGLAAGSDSYLMHPVEPAVLIATVRALLFARSADDMRRETDARFRTVFELASSGIALLSPDLVFVNVNPAFCKITGRPRTELVGTAAATIMATDFAGIRAALESVGRWDGILPVQRNDGTRAQVEFCFVRESGGEIRIGLATDITERLQAEEERERLLTSERAARAEAERSNVLKDEFLATLSHELRNPLSAILGWARVLRRTPGSPPSIAHALEAIERNSVVQAHLIEDLLDFAGIRFGKMHLDLEPADPRKAIRSAIEVVVEQAERKGVHLLSEIREESPIVLVDDARLQQVVWNLLSNAIKFTPAGGEIWVRSEIRGGAYEICVEDNGRGISAEFLPHLFERFSQQDSSTRKSAQGLGIGLAIVKHVVDMHQGTIEASSAGLNQGATFTVRLPLSQKHSGRAPEGGRLRSLAGVHVLVVDDDADARALILRILGDAGARLSHAEGADQALVQIRLEAPDVLVSDIGMAERDGYQLVRAVRAMGHGPDQLPAVALTAFSRLQDRADALAAGFQLHLAKPVNSERLIASIESLRTARVRDPS